MSDPIKQELLELVKDALAAWPDDDTPISGADMVEWFYCAFSPWARAIVAKAENTP